MCRFFLFNDALLYAQTLPATGSLLHSATIDLRNADVQDFAAAASAEFALQVLAPGKSFVVYCATAAEKAKWLAAVRGALTELRKDAASSQAAQFASAWAPDDTADACTLCKAKFTFVKRRHHCRSCGRLVCGACSDKKLLVKAVDPTHPVRVCTVCWDASRPPRSGSVASLPRTLSTSTTGSPQSQEEDASDSEETPPPT